MIKDPIKVESPHTDKHYMTVNPYAGTVAITIDGTLVGRSTQALEVIETAGGDYDPVFYLPRGDISMELLSGKEKSTYCPIKGNASYYDYGEAKDVAWSYEATSDRASVIKDYLAFRAEYVDAAS